VGAVINRRFVRLRCTEKECQVDGFPKLYHLWDVQTGRLVANDLEDDAGVTHREVVSDAYDGRG
jgi:hypothetical protein